MPDGVVSVERTRDLFVRIGLYFLFSGQSWRWRGLPFFVSSVTIYVHKWMVCEHSGSVMSPGLFCYWHLCNLLSPSPGPFFPEPCWGYDFFSPPQTDRRCTATFAKMRKVILNLSPWQYRQECHSCLRLYPEIVTSPALRDFELRKASIHSFKVSKNRLTCIWLDEPVRSIRMLL